MRRTLLTMAPAVPITLAIGIPLAYDSLPTAPSHTEELGVFARSSLSTAFNEIATEFDQKYSAKLFLTCGGSDSLSAKIAQASPNDVFASANMNTIDGLANAGLLSGTPQPFASVSLVMLVASLSASRIVSLADLARPGVRVELADKSVPRGTYATTIFGIVDATWGTSNIPAFNERDYVSFSKRVYANVVSCDTDVEQVVTRVTTGVADAGIAYRTDAIAQDGTIKFAEIPADVSVIAVCPMGAIRASQHATLAQRLIDFVLSSEGLTILMNVGFSSA